MRRLILLRHAKSDRPAGVGDRDRPLAPRGRRDAPRMGAYLATERLRPDRALISPARRTLETWEGVAPHLADVEAETVPSLYDASAHRILEVVRGAPASAATVLVIGHNPGLADLADLLAGEDPSERLAAMRAKFPTAALAVIAFDAGGWEAVDAGAGRLERFVTPRDLASTSADEPG